MARAGCRWQCGPALAPAVPEKNVGFQERGQKPKTEIGSGPPYFFLGSRRSLWRPSVGPVTPSGRCPEHAPAPMDCPEDAVHRPDTFAVAGMDRCRCSLEVYRLATRGLPPFSRPMPAYYLLSEVAVASRPSTRAASRKRCPARSLAFEDTIRRLARGASHPRRFLPCSADSSPVAQPPTQHQSPRDPGPAARSGAGRASRRSKAGN